MNRCTRGNLAVLLVLLAALTAIVPTFAGLPLAVTGNDFSLAETSDGSLVAWGGNGAGQLGDGTTSEHLTPVVIISGISGVSGTSGVSGVLAPAAFDVNAGILLNNSQVILWGANGNGQLGNSTVNPVVPNGVSGILGLSTVAGLSGVSSVGVIGLEGRGNHMLAVLTDGSLWAWGANASGQVGNGLTTDSLSPVKIFGVSGVIPSLSNVIASASAGIAHSIAVTRDFRVFAWGLNDTGQLGDGTQSQHLTPVEMTSLSGVVSVSSGANHNLAITITGSIFAWGNNAAGQLGDGSLANRLSPVAVTGLTGISGVSAVSGVSSVAAGNSHSIALQAGRVWAWGSNAFGQLGDGTNTNRSVPALVVGLSGISAVSGKYDHNLALKSDGSVWAWGNNANGELGDSTKTNRALPVQVRGLSGIDFLNLLGNVVVATPAAFSFTAQTNVALSTIATSNAITVSGINVPTYIHIAGGSYSVNGQPFTNQDGFVSNGASITVQLTSSANPLTLTPATLTIGGVSAIFNVTTLPGTAVASLNPTSLPFASRTVGSPSGALSTTLTNTGNATLTISSIVITAGANPGDFGQTNNCPASLAPAAFCTIDVTFTPAAVGARSATLTVNSNATNSAANVTLTGTGTTPILVTVITAGTGTGTVTSSPAGINCQPTCSTSFTSGSTVTLTATAAAGSALISWTGCDTAVGTTCTISPLAAPRSVTATFNTVVQRAFVSATGNNANTATFCAVTAPCKTFAAAVTVVADNGEVVALNTAPYGSVTLTRSISLTAAPGVYAGISVFAGSGITINTPNISVVLRGITINGQGGANGILVDTLSTGSKLSIENCVIANFSNVNGAGVLVNATATVRMANTLVRDSFDGLSIAGGATADISDSKFLKNADTSILVTGATAAITSTVATASGTGIAASADAKVAVVRSEITNNVTGVASQGTSGTVTTLSKNMVTGNTTGLLQSGTATLELLGNNNLRRNTNPNSGTITTAPRM